MVEVISNILLYALVFSSLMNPSICENAVGLSIEKPVDLCYFHLANLKNEFLICNNIQDDSLKSECYSELSSYVNNPKECENLKNPKVNNPRGNKNFGQFYYDRTACYTNVAQYTKNLSWCLYAGPKDKEECTTNIAKESVILGEDKENTFNQCIELINFSRNGCLIQIAKKNQNESICNSLLESPVHIRDICLDDIAISKLDYSNCKSIFCIKKVAISQNNQSLCTEINNNKYIVNIAEVSYDNSYQDEPEWRKLTSDECFNTIIENLTLEVLHKVETSNISDPYDPVLVFAALNLKDIWRDRIPYDLIYSKLEEKNNYTFRDLLLIDAIGTYSYKYSRDIHTSRRFIALFENISADENYPKITRYQMLHELTGLKITAQKLGYINEGEISNYLFFLNSLSSKSIDPEFSIRISREINTLHNFYPNIITVEPVPTVPKPRD